MKKNFLSKLILMSTMVSALSVNVFANNEHVTSQTVQPLWLLSMMKMIELHYHQKYTHILIQNSMMIMVLKLSLLARLKAEYRKPYY